MTEKTFVMRGTKTVTFEVTVRAKNKTNAIKKARAGDVIDQRITRCPDGFVLEHNPRVQEIQQITGAEPDVFS